MTASSSDRPSQSLPLCHGFGALSGRGPPLRAPTPWTTPLRQRTCRHCGRLFAVCAACDRGHAYCTPPCRTFGRRRSVQAARARHQRSPEGRLRPPRPAARLSRSAPRDGSDFPRTATFGQTLRPDGAPVPAPAPTRCVVCGRSSRWLIATREPRGGRRRRRRRNDDHARATAPSSGACTTASIGRWGRSRPSSASTVRPSAPPSSTRRDARAADLLFQLVSPPLRAPLPAHHYQPALQALGHRLPQCLVRRRPHRPTHPPRRDPRPPRAAAIAGARPSSPSSSASADLRAATTRPIAAIQPPSMR